MQYSTMPVKSWHVLLGSLAVLSLGVEILIDPTWFDSTRGVYFDYSKWQYLLSCVMIVVGLAGTIASLVSMNRKNRWDEMMICPECQQTIITYTAQDGRCPQCGGELEPLDGFYERHPELLDEDTEPGH